MQPFFPKEAMLCAFIVMKCEGFSQISDLVDFLNCNLLITYYCGFDITKPLPSYWTFDRFIRKLSHQVLQEIMGQQVKKLYEGRPNILDLMTNGEIQLIINSPIGKDSAHDDSYLRKAAIKNRIPYITTIAAARAAAEGIRRVLKHDRGNVRSLQEWHALIRDRH